MRIHQKARSSYAEPQPAIALDLIVKCKGTTFPLRSTNFQVSFFKFFESGHEGHEGHLSLRISDFY